MILCIANVLDEGGLIAIKEAIDSGSFVDGKATAGWASRLVKRNEQMAAGPAARTAQQMIVDALTANSVFAMGVLPRRFSPPVLARYTPGMSFGVHMDNAVMGEEQLRTDVSVTVFLSSPETYDGGELVMETSGGEMPYKLPAGAAVVYPSNMLHRVNQVNRGTREVAVCWVQSLIRSAERRELLFDLERVRRSLFERDGKTEEFDVLHKTTSNLRRMWVDS